MNVCPVCGTANPAATGRNHNHCLGCGEPLDVRPEPGTAGEAAPLPPLPDGGLASAMPDWLRPAAASVQPPAADAGSVPAEPRGVPVGHITPGPSAQPDLFDPTTLLTADDLPAWLRALAADPGPSGNTSSAPISTALPRPHGPSVSPGAVERFERSSVGQGAAPDGGMANAVDVPGMPVAASLLGGVATGPLSIAGSASIDRMPAAPLTGHVAQAPAAASGPAMPLNPGHPGSPPQLQPRTGPRRQPGTPWLPLLLVLLLTATVALLVADALRVL